MTHTPDGAASAAPPDLKLLRKSEVCEILSVSEASVDRWMRSEVRMFLEGLPVVAYDDHGFDPNGSGEAG